MKIVFMGNPEFSIPTLEKINSLYNIVCVVSNPEKKSGRGLKPYNSPVTEFAKKNNLKLLQPENLNDINFLNELQKIDHDIQVVVAFKKIPENIISLAKKASFNLHTSLLPKFRGAAPINWAIINGEKITGVTTFLLNNKIDTGDILLQKQTEINENMNAGELHDILSILGSDLVMETIKLIEENKLKPLKQDSSNIPPLLIKAPKIYPEDCKIDFTKDVNYVYNFIRGLSPYPTAWFELENNNKKIKIKVFLAEKINEFSNKKVKTCEFSKENFKIFCKNGAVNILILQKDNKLKMKYLDFYNGFKDIKNWKII